MGSQPGLPVIRTYVLRYQLFSASLLTQGAPLDVSDMLVLSGNARFVNPEPYPEIVWNAAREEFAAGPPNGAGTSFIRFGRTGNRIGTLGGGLVASSFTPGGASSGYGGVVRAGSGSLELTALSATGEEVGGRLPLLANGVEAPNVGIAIGWSGSEFAAAWTRDGVLWLQRISATGSLIGQAAPVA